MRGRGILISLLVLVFGIFEARCVDDTSQEERSWPTEFPPNPEDGSHLDIESELFYEGWYHSVVVPELGEAFFFLYGISKPEPLYPSVAFVYCGRQSTMDEVLQTFPIEDYSAAEEHRDVKIGEGARATALRIAGEAVEGEQICSWDINLAGGIPWRETMGYLTESEGLETNWTVGALRAEATGWVQINGETINFENATSYGDHNWGTTFPEEWVWVQAGSFEGSTVSISAAGGTVPLDGFTARAMMIGLFIDDEIVTFRSQDLNSIDFEASPGKWSIHSERRLNRISIEGHCELEQMFHLIAPTIEGLRPRAYETLSGTMELTFERRPADDAPWETVFQGVSDWASLEIGD